MKCLCSWPEPFKTVRADVVTLQKEIQHRLDGSNPENWKTWKQVKGTLNINDPDAWNQWLKCRFLGLIVAGAGGHELRRPLTT
jgi:hypothetical protein